MKTKSVLRAVILGGGIALLANPVWAGGSYGSHKKERTSESGAQASGLDQQQTRQVQQALEEKGFQPGEIDGIMGPQTEKALADFQRKNGLSPTGTVDQATAEELGIVIVQISPAPSDAMPEQGESSGSVDSAPSS